MSKLQRFFVSIQHAASMVNLWLRHLRKHGGGVLYKKAWIKWQVIG